MKRILRGDIAMSASVPLFLEYEAVIFRPKAIDGVELTVTDAAMILDALAARAELVQIHFLWRPWLRDPSDDMVLETAINGHAASIVTFNGRDFSGADSLGVEVVTPAAILRRLRHD